jgi:transposase
MRINYQTAIKESAEELAALLRKQNTSLLRRRIRFLLLLKSGKCLSQAEAGAHIGLGLRGAEKLWKLYGTKGIEGVLEYPFKGRKSKLSEPLKQALHEHLSKDSIQTLCEACTFVKKKAGVQISKPGMLYVFRAMGIKKKTGRPSHVHRDEKGAEAFKKKLSGVKAALRRSPILL